MIDGAAGAKKAMEASEIPMGAMAKDLEVRHCRVLLAVAEAGGVAAAARALGVAQSTVSEALLSLERIVGAPVTMRRPGRGAALTAAGETLIPHARLLISTSEAALGVVARQRQSAIRLGAVESISSFLLPGPLSAFRSLWPETDVRIAIGLCEDLRGRVGRDELDAALTIEGPTPQHSGRGQMADVANTLLRFIVSPRHPLIDTRVTRRDLEDRTFLLADHGGAFNVLLNSWLGNSARAPKRESAGSIDGVKRAVANSDAIGVLPDYAVSEELSERSLVALELQDPPPPVSLRLTTLICPPVGSPLDKLIGQISAALPGLQFETCLP